MVDDLKAEGYVNTDAVEAALRQVPRHLFIPWRNPEDAYHGTEGAIVDPDTTPKTCSTVSQPIAVAVMLEAFDIQPGMRILEIGAGSGYNAALLACLAGEHGRVVSVDVEDFLVEKARKQLANAGFGRVEVVCGDGALGYPPGAPYERIVATVGLPDIPAAWPEQLAPDGKIVVPLPLHVGGEPQDHVLVSLGAQNGYLEGVGLGSLQMVLFRGEAAGHGEPHTKITEERRGTDWRGARTDELKLKIYPANADVTLQPQEKHLRRRGSLTVLERVK